MSLHILEGRSSFRFFADHKGASIPFTGHVHLEYGSEEYHKLVRRMQGAGAGVFFSVNRTDGKGAKAENVIGVRTYYVDIDGLTDKGPALERLITAKLKPSAIVETKNGVHAYWYAQSEAPVDFDQYKRVQLGLIKAFNGDKSAKDIARVLRVPGTMHLKDPSDPFEVRIVHQLPKDETPYYSPQQLLYRYPHPKIPKPVPVQVRNSPRSWSMFLEDLDRWDPVPGERNNVMLLSAGVAIAFGVREEEFVDTMQPIVDTWNTGRNVRGELQRVARWAYSRGNAIPAFVLAKRGVPIRRGL